MTDPNASNFENVDSIISGLLEQGYIASQKIATAIFIAENLTRDVRCWSNPVSPVSNQAFNTRCYTNQFLILAILPHQLQAHWHAGGV